MMKVLISQNLKPGFTLVESLVSISIFLIVATATMSSVHSSLQARRMSEDRVIATYLAVDAIEFVRGVRDTIRLKDGAWSNFLALCSSGNKCRIDSRPSYTSPSYNFVACPSNGCPVLRLNSNGYNYASGANTKFIRTITIEPQGDHAELTALVTWTTQGGRTSEVRLREDIYNW